MHGTHNAAREAAAEYIANGWRVVPVPLGEKSPGLPDWPNNTYTADDITGNVGVILGHVSGHLADVDLDAHWALELAPYFLPHTVTFGRESKRASHYLYFCEGLRSQRFTFERGGKQELVELRAKNARNDRCGHQSVFPGSTHASGERIEWDPDCADEITTIARGELIWRATRLAVACVIIDDWQPGTQRNNKARAIAGGLLQMGWTAGEVEHLFEAIFEVANVEQEQRSKDQGAVERTIETYARGEPVTSWATLRKDGILAESVIRMAERLGRTPAILAHEAKLARSRVGSNIRERVIAEAQNTDALGEFQDAAALLLKDPANDPGVEEDFFGRRINMAKQTKPIEYVCEGLAIAPGKVTAVVGYSGAGKGPFVTQLALCIATGKPFLGMPVARRQVGYMDFETGGLLDDRLWRINNALETDKEELSDWMFPYHSARQIDAAWLAAFDDALEPGMVVFVDSYTSAVAGDINEKEYAEAAWALGRIAEPKGAVVILLMHSRKKQSQNRQASMLESIAGSSALSAALQTAILLSRPDEDEPERIAVRCGRAPGEPFKGFELKWHDVPEPGMPMTTPGERARHGKWGLLAKKLEPLTPTAAAEKVEKARPLDMMGLEAALLEQMRRDYPDGIKVAVADLVRYGSSATRQPRRIAVRNLVQRGALSGNFHWKDPPNSNKLLVWLPGAKSEAGVVQL